MKVLSYIDIKSQNFWLNCAAVFLIYFFTIFSKNIYICLFYFIIKCNNEITIVIFLILFTIFI